MKRGNILKKTTIIQGLATVTILAGMAMPMMVQAQESGQVPQTVKADFSNVQALIQSLMRRMLL